jgi:Tol biopolymer transport system component
VPHSGTREPTGGIPTAGRDPLLNPGTKLGPYEIQSPLGAGGMGEVYRARDTRLDRSVAIKILPSHLSENPDAKQRFDREARTISSLNHPNICTLHDVGHQDGIDYLVMEYLEGETLADRLRKGPMPVEQVLRHGIEICEGLEKAHRGGVIHRDLKPGNIMLTKTGAKLMDFGLAKASVASAAPISGLTATLTTPPGSHPLTAQGTVVGTFQYMSPEQVEGKEADDRSDIFALGCVLYEMATGKRAFEGKTAASAMAAVLEREPAPISSVRPAIPLALERLVKACLAKDPDERWQTVHDVKLQLKQIADGGSQAAPAMALAPTPPAKHTNALAWGVAAILAIVAAAALGAAYLANQKDLPVLRLAIAPPDKAQFNISGDDSGPAVISPNGRYVVFSANGSNGPQLYLRALDSVSSQPLPGTEGGGFPFWSPDSRSVGFFTNPKLKRIDIGGGNPITICDASMARGGSWNQDGTIIAALSFTAGISRIVASGGAPTAITRIDNVTYSSHRWPFFLPDGKHFLYNAVNHDAPNSPETGVFLASLDGKENRLLFHTTSRAIYASGYLLSLRDNALVAQPFDPVAGKFTGEAQTLSENVNLDAGLWRANLSASTNGVLLYASGTSYGAQSMSWLDRNGKLVGSAGDRGDFYELELSPDQKTVAATNADSAAASIWVHDLASKLKTRLSFTGGVQRGPVWSPDGRQVAYASDQQTHISAKEVGGSGPQQTLYSSPDANIQKVTSWSPDGRYILYEQGNGLNQKLFVLPLFGDHKPFPYGESPGGMFSGAFSPDGRWVAYHANENGQMQVFVAPFPWTGAKWQVSPSNGSWVRWRGDGKEIYYDDFSSMVAVEVDGSGAAFRVGGSKPLFPIKMRGLSREYDVSRDGQRFLIIRDNEGSSQSLTVVQNWLSEVKKK